MESETGTVTFLFTDIEGSTRLLQRIGDVRFARVLADHHRLLHEAATSHAGTVVDERGDGFLIVFGAVRDAATAAVTAQRALTGFPWPDDAPVRVRMGLHTGDALLRDGSYVGYTVHRAHRVADAANGGQILLSGTTAELVEADLGAAVHLRDLGPHRLKDLGRPEHLFQVCGPGLPDAFPPLRSIESARTNLPVQLKHLVPRPEEAAAVTKLFEENRCVTITGVGGSGKTRLALEVSADLIDRWPGGVWFVDLGRVADPDLVVRQVASATGVPGDAVALPGLPGAGRGPLVERVVDHIGTSRMLLLLDNCEHVLGAAAEVGSVLLSRCPNLFVLATSREPLGVDGEATWRMPSMPVPARGEPDVGGYPSVRLFVDRARLVRPGFSLTPDNAEAITDICRRVDGLPLPIELAAARVKVLTPKQIAERLDDQFRTLVGGIRTALERQQTLRASVDWSYQTLGEPERVLLRRFSVFAGGAFLEDVEAVCAHGEADVVEGLAALVDKSMLESDEEGDRIRYRMLEPIRQYAREKLVESGESAAVRARHRNQYLEVAESNAMYPVMLETTPAVRALEGEAPNLQAALEYALSEGEADVALRFCAALGDFWSLGGRIDEGLDAVRRTLDAAPLDAPSRPRALAMLGMLAFYQWDFETASKALDSFLASYDADDESEPDGLVVRALVLRGHQHYVRGMPADARPLFERALDMIRVLGLSDLDAAFPLLGLGLSLHAIGETELAWQKIRDVESIVTTRPVLRSMLGWLAHMHTREGDVEAARARLTDAAEAALEADEPGAAAFWTNELAYKEIEAGDLTQAGALLEEALRLSRLARYRSLEANCLHSLGELGEAAGHVAAARARFEESLALARSIASGYLVAECAWGLARCAQADGDAKACLRWSRAALDASRSQGGLLGRPVRRLAQGLVHAGYHGEGVRLLGAWESWTEDFGGDPASLEPPEREQLDGALEEAHAVLAPETFAVLWDEGRALTLDEAADRALVFIDGREPTWSR